MAVTGGEGSEGLCAGSGCYSSAAAENNRERGTVGVENWRPAETTTGFNRDGGSVGRSSVIRRERRKKRQCKGVFMAVVRGKKRGREEVAGCRGENEKKV
ncbi:hypothetical protein HAX54_019282 [Datura stramonium]|uniref:Uncharacterized protein n=1 Tax=Datura stramonium TaxID=4076 RepID=A0ABS8UQW4_DATST|nr:hypothetical protein [Datura stramonium]